MSLTMYDLAAADPKRRFSPYCWRIRLAIAHKGLAVETIPWRFTDKDAIAFSGQGKVPVLVDDGQTVVGSWMIANYLEEKHPDRPSLFGGAAGTALSRFVERWSDNIVLPGLMPLILFDVFEHIHEKDREYFRTSREQRLGMTLEAVCADRDSRVEALRKSLEPLRSTLKDQQFLGGDQPNYADYIVFSDFMWARSISPYKILASDDQVATWRTAMLDRFEVARNAPGYDG